MRLGLFFTISITALCRRARDCGIFDQGRIYYETRSGLSKTFYGAINVSNMYANVWQILDPKIPRDRELAGFVGWLKPYASIRNPS